METLRQYAARLRATTREVQIQALEKIVRQHEPEIVDANIEQLMDGKDAKGKKLPKYRNKKYAAKKKMLNPKGVTDLKLTGDFHRQMHLENDNFPFTITSENWKTPLLLEKYDNNEIFGVSKKHLDALQKDYFLEAVQNYYRSVLLLR
jgi:hypothetical protein